VLVLKRDYNVILSFKFRKILLQSLNGDLSFIVCSGWMSFHCDNWWRFIIR